MSRDYEEGTYEWQLQRIENAIENSYDEETGSYGIDETDYCKGW